MVLQTEFNLISSLQAEQMTFKSRRLWYEHGERASKILAYQLGKSEATQFISEIRTKNGQITTNPQKMNESFQSFYSGLYHSESLHSPELFDNFFDIFVVPNLNLTSKEKFDACISIEEVKMAINSMQGGKSPGPNGFPVKFFYIFKDSLAPLLRNMFIEFLNAKSLPMTLRQVTVLLLLKPNKDPLDCFSYRPKSLLYVNFKTLSKTLAIRLEQQLPSLMAPDQTGFIKGRHGLFNLRRFFNILNTPSTSTPEIASSLEAEKAFERVEWEYLFYTLNKFGFGPKFISWIRLL